MSGQKALSLILARELSSNLATPMFLIDAAGMLVFFNEAAEAILGRRWGDVGEISSLEFGAMLDLQDADGEKLSIRDSPAALAFNERRPTHATLRPRVAGDARPLVEVTSIPLFASADEFHGVVTMFWVCD